MSADNPEGAQAQPRSRATTTGRPVQRWALIATWTAFLSALPSVAWRLAMLAGAPTGFAGTETYRQSSSALLYVLGLDVIQVCGAIACLGLARPWGERVPAWVPGIGGREIPRLLPLIVGGVGNLILYRVIWRLAIHFTLVWTGVEQGWTPTDGMNATQTTVIALCYAPMLAWPAALSIALVGYALRRRRRLPAHPAPDAGA